MKFAENSIVTLAHEIIIKDKIYPIGNRCIVIHAYKYDDIYEVELQNPEKIIRLSGKDFREFIPDDPQTSV